MHRVFKPVVSSFRKYRRARTEARRKRGETFLAIEPTTTDGAPSIVTNVVIPNGRAQSPIYRNWASANLTEQQKRFGAYCGWANRRGQNLPEYLLPQIRVRTSVEPFLFERNFVANRLAAPTTEQLAALSPWHYQIEFGDVSTRSSRMARDWIFHRYRAGLLVGLAAEIAGQRRSDLSVLDVACHCGAFALEFASRGFGAARGFDLRKENIEQANFLAKTFGISNASFAIANARDLGSAEAADILFCAGLLYHVTFPMELLAGVYAKTREFAIVDSLAQNHPFSGFHLVCSKNTDLSIEGETHYEFAPTYRAIVDGLHAVGFQDVYEIIGDRAAQIPLYQDRNVRSFLAVKNRDGVFAAFRSRFQK